MITKTIRTVVLCLGIALFVVSSAGATAIGYYTEGGILGNAPAYDWWYGCSPTSAGMMMGYYDINGYSGLRYDNLVPGGTAELSTFPSTNTWDALAKNVIASQEHVNDFYKGGMVAGYENSGDDATSQLHNFNSLADFMGTSQDSVGNVNGSTTFWYSTKGAKFTAQDAITAGVWNEDGMYGILEYMQYAGYDVAQIYTQITDNLSHKGFSFADYMAEINAGRVVMLHVEGHSMFGYGYDADGQLVYLNDTWSSGPHTMTWGGSYADLDMWGVTVLEPTGGSPVPVPATIFLLAPGLILMVRFRRQFKGRE